MDHFTSPAPRGRDETQARSLTRRAFLAEIAAGTVALGAAAALSSPALAASAPKTDPPSIPATVMTGARYVAMLGGVTRERIYNEYVEKRWTKIASGPLIDAIDNRTLVICPQCLFVNYPRIPCPMCLQCAMVVPDDVSDYVTSLRRDYDDLPGMMEEFLTEQRVERAVDLFGGPDSAQFCGQTLYIRKMLRSEAKAA